MQAHRFLADLAAHGRTAHLVGDLAAGVIAALDLEGRLFAVRDGLVLNRCDPAVLCAQTDKWRNPGGDVLWPAPEGSRLGYHYAGGTWQVPPALTGARWRAVGAGAGRARLSVDLEVANVQGLAIPLHAERMVAVARAGNALVVDTCDRFVYRGDRPLTRAQALLAPWSLCQFDCGPGCAAFFPDGGPDCVWDLYGPSDHLRRLEGGCWHVRTEGGARFQLGLDARVPWIGFRRPDGLSVRRSAAMAAEGDSFIDIADRPAHADPDARGCRYSIYGDSDGFMELEAAGAMPAVLAPGTSLTLAVTTRFSIGPADG